MAGMEHLKAALRLTAGEGARYAVLGAEAALGHSLGHATAQAQIAADEAMTAVTTNANVDNDLALFLQALDLRYAAGVHAPPAQDKTAARNMLGFVANGTARSVVANFDDFHGRAARGAARSGFVGADAATAARAAADAEIVLWLADLDARYAAGATATPEGAVLDAGKLALQIVASLGCGSLVRLEETKGHFASTHWVPHINATNIAAEDFVAANAFGSLGLLLLQWDGRYQAHA